MISTLKCDLLLSKGQSLVKEGKLDDSVEVYNQALAIKPHNTHVLLHKAISLSRQERHEEAIAVINVAIASKPDNSILYQCLGRIYYERREYNKAIKAFDHSLALCAENELTLCLKHLTLLAKGENIKESCLILKEHVGNTNSEFKAKLLVYCETYLFQNHQRSRSLEKCISTRTREHSSKLDEVVNKVEYYLSEKSINMRYLFKPQERIAYAHYARAHYNRLSGDIESAISECIMALECIHDLHGAKVELFDLYLSADDPQSAWTYFEQLDERDEYMEEEKKDSLDLSIIFNLGRYYYQTGKFDNANKEFKYVSEKAPKEYAPFYYMGLCDVANNRLKLAHVKFQNSMQQDNPRVTEIRLDEMIRIVS